MEWIIAYWWLCCAMVAGTDWGKHYKKDNINDRVILYLGGILASLIAPVLVPVVIMYRLYKE